jgi:hypothetical protein
MLEKTEVRLGSPRILSGQMRLRCTRNRSQMRQESRISFALAKLSLRFCRNNTQEPTRIVWAVHAAFISLNAD